MKKLAVVLVIVIALVFGSLFLVVSSGLDVGHAQQSQSLQVHTSSTPGSSVMGLPAITPHIQVTSSLTSSSTPSPTYSLDDAIHYVTTHPMPDALITGSKPVIVKAVFLSSQEVSKLMKGESTGVPNGTLLCYIELQGTFTFSGGSGTPVIYHTGVEVFDAYTGNLLIAGGQ